MIFIGSGARPLIPQIEGIEDIEYLTNNNVFSLTKKPESKKNIRFSVQGMSTL